MATSGLRGDLTVSFTFLKHKQDHGALSRGVRAALQAWAAPQQVLPTLEEQWEFPLELSKAWLDNSMA